MSARRIVANELEAQLPSAYRVYPYAVAPDGVEHVSVSVERSAVSRGASQGLWSEDVSVYVLVGIENPERAEDMLDLALDDVLKVLERNHVLAFNRAERSSIENHHGYHITVTVQTQNTEN